MEVVRIISMFSMFDRSEGAFLSIVILDFSGGGNTNDFDLFLTRFSMDGFVAEKMRTDGNCSAQAVLRALRAR